MVSIVTVMSGCALCLICGYRVQALSTYALAIQNAFAFLFGVDPAAGSITDSAITVRLDPVNHEIAARLARPWTLSLGKLHHRRRGGD